MSYQNRIDVLATCNTFLVTQNHFRALISISRFKRLLRIITRRYKSFPSPEVARAATIQRNQWTQFRRNNRHNTYDHPFRVYSSLDAAERFTTCRRFKASFCTLPKNHYLLYDVIHKIKHQIKVEADHKWLLLTI